MSKGLQKNRVPALRRGQENTGNEVSHEAEIGSEGGTVTLKNAGLTITFPPSALSQKTKVTVLTHRQIYGFAVDLEPAVALAVPAKVTQKLHETRKDKYYLLGSRLVQDIATIDSAKLMKQEGDVLTAEVTHFSGYMVACGRDAVPCDPALGDPNCVWVDGES